MRVRTTYVFLSLLTILAMLLGACAPAPAAPAISWRPWPWPNASP